MIIDLSTLEGLIDADDLLLPTQDDLRGLTPEELEAKINEAFNKGFLAGYVIAINMD